MGRISPGYRIAPGPERGAIDQRVVVFDRAVVSGITGRGYYRRGDPLSAGPGRVAVANDRIDHIHDPDDVDLHPGFLAHFARCGLTPGLAEFLLAAGNAPLADPGFAAAPDHQDMVVPEAPPPRHRRSGCRGIRGSLMRRSGYGACGQSD